MSLKVGVIGAGTLGTAISQLVTNNGFKVILYARNKSVCEDINSRGYNSNYSDIKLNPDIVATSNLSDLNSCEIIFLTIPSSAFRNILNELTEIIDNDVIIVTTAKGIEYPSLKTMGEIIKEFFDDNYVALSGPNFASEIMSNLPTVTNIASNNRQNSKIVKKVLSNKNFKVKIIDDVKGIELCGVLKNINAIANGICEGMNINENARFAILTNGFRDTARILEAIGGNPDSVNDYCGFGDLTLTATSTESRNHTLGILYGQRLILDRQDSGSVYEGKISIKAVKDICDKNNIQSNIVDFVYDIIIEKISPIKSFNKLWDKLEN